MILISLLLCVLLILSAVNNIKGLREKPYLYHVNHSVLIVFFIIALTTGFFITAKSFVQVELFHVGSIQGQISLMFDKLTWVMLVLVSFVSLMIFKFSDRYLLSDANQSRFNGQLFLLTFSVSFLVASGNLLTAFCAWQFIGLSLYLLLNHFHYDTRANRAAKKKFMLNRIGDLCFIMALILTLHEYGTSSFDIIFHSVNPVNPLILLCLTVAVMTKSAQFPFHIWLIDTMEAPTPISALMHAGVINSGGFLLARLSPWFIQNPIIMVLIALIGFITALLGQQFLNYQVDTKKRLAYSTMGQMGFMVLQCGTGAFISAVFHLFTHGFYKAYLFLSSGETLLPASKNTQTQNIVLGRLIGGIITVAFLLAGIYLQNQIFSLNPVIWFFLAITLYSFTFKIVSDSSNLKMKAIQLLALMVVYCVYLLLLKQFYLTLGATIKDVTVFTMPGYIILLLIFISAYWFIKNPTNELKKALYHKMAVESFFRHYILNPVRNLGDKLIYLEHLISKKTRTSTTIIGIAIFFIYLILALFNHKPSSADSVLISTFALALLIIFAIRANRTYPLPDLLKQVFFIIILIALVALSLGRRIDVLLSFYQLVNGAVVVIALYVLLQQVKYQPQLKNGGFTKNRLPLCHLYFCILFCLLIGIPGTSTFITELYLFNALIMKSFIMTGLFAVSMLLIALFVLHTLQLHFFNPETYEKSSVELTPFAHVLVISVIGFNILTGIFPQLLINSFNYFIGGIA